MLHQMTRRDALIGLLAIRRSLAQGADLKVAAVEAPITPAWPTTLWGYDNTTHYTRGVLDDIFAKAILFDAGKRFLLITLDVGAIGFDLTRRIARRIHEEIGLDEQAVAI